MAVNGESEDEKNERLNSGESEKKKYDFEGNTFSGNTMNISWDDFQATGNSVKSKY